MFIFELKRTKVEEHMEKACIVALTQIKEKHYDDDFVDDYEEIIHYGVAFYKKRCCVKLGD